MSQPFNPQMFLMMNLPLIIPLFADPSVKNAFTELAKTPEGQKKLKDSFMNHFKMFVNETLGSAGLPPLTTGGKKKAKKSPKKSPKKSAKKSAKKMSGGKKRKSPKKKSPKKH